jgi:hypothetical protein
MSALRDTRREIFPLFLLFVGFQDLRRVPLFSLKVTIVAGFTLKHPEFHPLYYSPAFSISKRVARVIFNVV